MTWSSKGPECSMKKDSLDTNLKKLDEAQKGTYRDQRISLAEMTVRLHNVIIRKDIEDQMI